MRGTIAMKYDMSKDYDRVEWVFFLNLLMSIDFDRRWVNLVMDFVSLLEY